MLILHDGCAVYVFRGVPAECLIEKIVFGTGGEILVSSHYVCDAHEMVIHDVGEVVGGHSVALDEDLILELLVLHADVSVYQVMESRDALGRHLLADDIWSAGGKFCFDLFF